MMNAKNPIRVLHVIGHLDQGGVETWLVNLLEHITSYGIQMDFLVGTDTPGAYDERVLARGSRILPCLSPSEPLRYARSFRHVLAEHGPYDVVHSHIHHFSGFVQFLAARQRVPLRITQSHLADEAGSASPQRRAYVTIMRQLITRYSTGLLAVSDLAGESLYGPAWPADDRCLRLPCGIDLDPFSIPAERAAVREEFGIPHDAFVVGHVGAFRPQKNHPFLLKVFAEVRNQRPDARLLLVGTGSEEADIRTRAEHLGLSDHIIFAGGRQDVPRVLQGAPDVFLFPSHFEGLPLALVEAQAAALPCVISDTISTEADLVPELITRRSLAEPVDRWVQSIFDAPATKIAPSAALDAVAQSPMNLLTGLETLVVLYRTARLNDARGADVESVDRAVAGSGRHG